VAGPHLSDGEIETDSRAGGCGAPNPEDYLQAPSEPLHLALPAG